ncbi:MAG TPA: hypothetical protein VGH49_10135 [Xanthobacteraceae bacterium]
MKLVRVTPKFGPLPELQTFQCGDCEDVETFESTAPLEPAGTDDKTPRP